MGAAVKSPGPSPCSCTRETPPASPCSAPRGGLRGQVCPHRGAGPTSTGPLPERPGRGPLGCLLQAGVSKEAGT